MWDSPSFCDFFANVSRGWVLGWNASTLTPLAANQLNDKLAPSSTNNFFLSSVWMSGSGLAASPDWRHLLCDGKFRPRQLR